MEISTYFNVNIMRFIHGITLNLMYSLQQSEFGRETLQFESSIGSIPTTRISPASALHSGTIQWMYAIEKMHWCLLLLDGRWIIG